jgi:hypothetical protein
MIHDAVGTLGTSEHFNLILGKRTPHPVLLDTELAAVAAAVASPLLVSEPRASEGIVADEVQRPRLSI